MPQATEPVTIDGLALGPFATNCYAVADPATGACWIVDASWDIHRLIDRVRNHGWRPSAVILTHAHVDHIAGLEDVRRAFAPIEVLIHRAEAAWLTDPALNLSAAMGDPIVCRDADRLLDHGDTLRLGAHEFRVIHTPGHSPGGIVLSCPDSRVAFVGDTLFNGSIGRFDFPTSDGPTLARSIRNEIYRLPSGTRVLPGHGPETTVGHEMHTNPFVRADGVAQEVIG